MGAKIGSFIATLLLSVPLAAVGLMAVFGVPQLAPVIASPDQDGVVRSAPSKFSWPSFGSRNSESPATSREILDDAPRYDSFGEPLNFPESASATRLGAAQEMHPEFSQRGAHSHSENFGQNRPATAIQHAHHEQSTAVAGATPVNWENLSQPQSPPAQSQQPASHWSQQPQQPASFPTERQNSSLEATSATKLTWPQASLRLAELGIQDFHVERGSKEGHFLFVCMFTPGNASHVTHRFEAEAEDPLTAVNQALQQVDSWMQKRFASENFPSQSRDFSGTDRAFR